MGQPHHDAAGRRCARGSQIATLTRLARDILAADETLNLLSKAEEEARALPPSDLQHEALRQIRVAVETHRRIPAELVERRAAVRAQANAAWIEARATDNFALFAPWLEEPSATLATMRMRSAGPAIPTTR